MAENVTPVVLKVKDFAPREVLLVNYKFKGRSGSRYRSWRSDHDPCKGPE